MPDFLLEIGLEEVPARMIDGAEEELRRRVAELLEREALIVAQTSKTGSSGAPPTVEVEAFSTPRRLAVLARDVRAAQSDTEEQLKGPSVQVAYKDGQPTVAAIKFAEKAGTDVSRLERIKDAKGEYISARVTRKGRSAEQILAEALPKEINALYWAKNMYWREGKPERFVRPVRWMVALLGGQVVPLEYGGVTAGRNSRGHRVLGVASPESRVASHEVNIKEPASYAADLKQSAVVASREERVQIIRKALDAATRQVAGARWREDKELLDTVVNLTESPSVLLGNFEREFLTLPEEVLVTVMRDHQKYFAVEDASGKLAPHFLAVMNIDADPQGIIRHGNERVLRARFNDARFFWNTDQKHPLRERVEWLKKVTFQKDLGSYFDKTIRVQKLASQISQTVENAGVKVRPGIVHKAALLAKTDLTTELVKEFTELQGIVGGLYATAQGLDPAVGNAIYDQYRPESMEDAVPRTVEGAVLSIADKADSIAGMFALGLIPSGSKDPFALRRQANGIVKIIAEHKLALSIQYIMGDAFAMYMLDAESQARLEPKRGKYLEDVRAFFRERLEFYLREARGFAYDVVNAVLAADADSVVDAISRAEALAQVRPSEDFEHISIAFKRMKNILRQAREAGKGPAPGIESGLFEEDAERALSEAASRAAMEVETLRHRKDYEKALKEIAALRPVVDTFFDKVMVMVEDERVRANRLALLDFVMKELSTIADFSEIVTEGK